MKTIDLNTWETIKLIPEIWKPYGYIKPEEKDLGVLIIGQHIILPKFFVERNKEHLRLYTQTSHLCEPIENHVGLPINKFETNISPRDEQVIILDTIADKVSQNLPVYGQVVATPGFGKSVIAIKACEIVKQKTLIIVPNDILNEQFIGSIVEFSNLEKEDIGLLQGSDLDHILKHGHFEKDIVIAKIQSLYGQFKKYTIESLRELYKVFGLVIYDEAHVGTASDGYSLTVNMFKTNNIISMTATPFRNGINDFIFQNMTGGVLYESTHQNLVPDIILHCFQTILSTSEIQKLQYFMSDYTMFMSVLNSILFNKDDYFDWIVQWVQYRYNEGHSIAVLFSTNAMVGKLHDKLVALGLPAGKITGKTDKKGKKAIDYITYDDVTLIYDETIKRNPRKKKVVEIKLLKGSDNKYQVTSSTRKLITDSFPEITIKQTLPELSERDQVKELPILVSNFKFLSAGYDKSELSCVIFGSLVIGKIPVNQTLGRIARVNKNKRQDIVAHFMVPDIYDKLFPNNVFTLVNNIKKRYPSNFRYEGFDWERKKKK